MTKWTTRERHSTEELFTLFLSYPIDSQRSVKGNRPVERWWRIGPCRLQRWKEPVPSYTYWGLHLCVCDKTDQLIFFLLLWSTQHILHAIRHKPSSCLVWVFPRFLFLPSPLHYRSIKSYGRGGGGGICSVEFISAKYFFSETFSLVTPPPSVVSVAIFDISGPSFHLLLRPHALAQQDGSIVIQMKICPQPPCLGSLESLCCIPFKGTKESIHQSS